jgi:hypothetical protein
MELYCQEGTLISVYSLLTLSANFFLFKIIQKNTKKAKFLTKYQRVSKIYDNSFNSLYYLEFFKNKNIVLSSSNLHDLIILNKTELLKKNFYGNLLKKQFLTKKII